MSTEETRKAIADVEVPATYGKGIAVPCTCGHNEQFQHSGHCRGSAALADHLDQLATRGIVSGTLTQAERDLLTGVTDLIRHRLGQRGGTEGFDLDRFARLMIRQAAAEICGEGTVRS